MRIALVAPLCEAVPPRLYGGTERIVAYLADALVERGHEVTLFASGDSRTRARLVACRDQALRLDPNPCKSDVAAHLSMLHEVRRRADEFDVIHFHVDLMPCPLFEDRPERTLTTMHGRLDLADLKGFYRRWSRFPLVSISDYQRRPLPDANWAATIYHGLPLDLYPFQERPRGEYLAFLGRMSPEKRPDRAIRIAQRLGMPLKIVAKVDAADEVYFREQIRPLLQDPLVEFVGELGDAQKAEFLGQAAALLFPIDWPEPFGLVVIEAMACGTPVIAWNHGSVPELVESGVTGFIVNSEEEAAAAVGRLGELDRRRVRARFEERFSVMEMTRAYEAVYERLAQGEGAGPGRPSMKAAGREPASSVEAWQATEPGVALNPVEEASALEPITVESEDARMPYRLFALKHMDTFLVADAFGDVAGKGDGLFRNDTRVLSELRMTLGDKPLSLLSAALSSDNVFFTAHVTNRPLPPLGGRSIPEGVIHIERTRFLWRERLYERLQLVNYGDARVETPLYIRFGADFRDMFEVRGNRRPRRGQLLEPELDEHSVSLRYLGLDGEERQSVIAFSQAPDRLTTGSAEFRLVLDSKQCTEIYLEVGPDRPALPSRERYRAAAAQALRNMRRKGQRGGALRSAERVFNNWVEQSRADLALLTTELATGPYPYAGIPWFSTTFGRDGIITAMQMLWFDPSVARGVLSFLAENQARELSRFQDAAPGKIMHEARKGEMTRLKELPFGQYYGGVDTTPLFVMLAGAYADRTGDLAFIDQIWPALRAALDWIEQAGDLNGDGLLGYARAEQTGLSNQGWKDSEDSVFHQDGCFPQGPISLVEVQGYQYAAYLAMAELARRRGEEDHAGRWRARAERVRDLVEERFWMEDRQFYGLAIDGRGALCRVRSSNAGHLLFTGLVRPDRAQQVIRQLLSADFDSGWGLRTLASDEKRYNPMSYHNGSVWPHDTAICAAGMARYGQREGAAHVLSELFDAAVHFGMRLPELFCGFQRFPGEGPVAYPVACLPQAWSSGAVFMILQACLGVRVDGWRNEIHIDRPYLPQGINHLMVKGLPLGGGRIDLVFQRVRDRVVAFTEGHEPPEVKVLAHV